MTWTHMIRWVAIHALSLCLCRLAAATIVVSGVADRTNYVSSVTFCAWSEPGYSYQSRLNGSDILEDRWVTLSQPGYHELLVVRTNVSTLVAETNLTRFTITTPERFMTETGIPTWTPYPPIDSSSNECASAQLQLIAPANYPADMEMPMVAITEDATGTWKRLNGSVTCSGFDPIGIRRGAGFSFLPAQTAGTFLSCTGTLKSISDVQTTQIDPSTYWTISPSVIMTNTVWGPDARILLTTNLLVTNNAILTIQTGTIVRINAGLDISFRGTLRVNGSRQAPVVFTPSLRAQPWGGFIMNGTSCLASVSHAIITGTGSKTNWMTTNVIYVHRQEQAALFLGNGARAALTNVYLIDLRGQAWVGESATLSARSCLVQRAPTSGQLNHSTSTFVNCTFQEIPNFDESFADADNDGLYLEYGRCTLSDTFIGWVKDDGIDTGSYHDPIWLSNCWFESCFHEGVAMAGGTGRLVNCEALTVINSGQAIEAGYGQATARLNNCLFVNNLHGLRFGDNYPTFTCSGLIAASNSMLLHNQQDIWNFAFDVWGPKYPNLLAQSNLLTTALTNYPSNAVWNASNDWARLTPFISRATTNGPVGIGFPRPSSTNMTATTTGVAMVSLSMFATSPVSVNYSIIGGTAVANEDYILTPSTLTFQPGEFRKALQFPIFNNQPTGAVKTLILQLSNAVNAEISATQSLFTFYFPTNQGTNVANTLIGRTSSWSYLDDGSNQQTNWRVAAFSDGSWQSGPALLGYGDADIVTTNSYGTNISVKHRTYYYRRGFNLVGAGSITSATFSCQVDDGVVLYLNGTEIGRYLMTNGAINYQSLAISNSPETNWVDFVVTNPGLFRVDANLLAAEVHQAAPDSSDIRFDLSAKAWWLPGPLDDDGDGLDDNWEYLHFSTTNAADGGTLSDWDRDGFDDMHEYRAGTHPANPESQLHMHASFLQATGSQCVITWSGVLGKTYTVQSATNMFSPWNLVYSGIPGMSPLNSCTVTVSGAQQVWRIKLE